MGPTKSNEKGAGGAERDAAEQPKKSHRDQPLSPSRTEREIDNLPGSGGSAEVR
jgi:hypothetical protein